MVSSDELARFEQELAPLAHGAQALWLLRDFLKGVGKVAVRQRVLAEHMLQPPIVYEQVRDDVAVEPFHLLQGDDIRTDAGYVLGSRQIGNPSYLVATSTCDLMPGRREIALLLPIEARRASDYLRSQKLENDLSNLIVFRSTRYFYLSALPDDQSDVLFNVARLDPLAQCANEALVRAERRASMTTIGWRVFGSVLRSVQIREAESEANIRLIAEHQA